MAIDRRRTGWGMARIARTVAVYLGLVVAPALAVVALLHGSETGTGGGSPTVLHSGSLSRLLLAVAVIVAVSKAAGYGVRRLGHPAVVGEIGAGILLGPSVLGAAWPDGSAGLFSADVMPQLGTLAQIGVVLFVFLAGTEVNTAMLRGQKAAAVVVSHVGIALPFLLGVVLAILARDRFAPPQVSTAAYTLFLGVAMSITALPVMARILIDLRMQRSRVGTLALTCAVVDDVTAWCLLAAVVALVTVGSLAGVGLTVGLAAVFGAVLVFAVRPLLSRGDGIAQRRPELAVLVALLGLLACATYTEWIGVHSIVGGFLFGLVFPAEGQWARTVRQAVGGLVMILLLPLFFVVSGMRTQLGLIGFDGQMWLWLAAILLVATAGKFVGSTAAARAMGVDWRTSLQVGTLMNCRGLTELIVLNVGLELGVLTDELFTLMVIMALVSTVATAPLLRLLRRSEPPEDPQSMPQQAPEPVQATA